MSFDCMIFIHIPKTAGTSFFDALSQHVPEGAIAPYSDEQVVTTLSHSDPTQRRIDLSSYRLLRTHATFSIDNAIEGDISYVTMLRDPVKRVLSLYKFVKYVPNSSPMHTDVKDMTLDDFLDYQHGRHTTNRQVRALAGDLGGTPIDPYQPLTDGAYLDAALANLNRFAFVGLVEEYTLSLYLLAYTFGWPPIQQKKTLNVTPPTPSEPIPEDTMRRLRERVALDYALYDAAQQRFHTQADAMFARLLHAHRHPPGIRAALRRRLNTLFK